MESGKVENVELIIGSLLDNLSELDSHKGDFDLITMNLVLHHLDTDQEDYPNLRQVIGKLIHVLKPGGKFIVNHFLQKNLDGIWHFSIHPVSRARHFKRFAPHDVMKDAFLNAGFENYTEIKCTEPFYGL